jgi:transcriptional regulator with XRE-family HTH domain
MITAGQIKAARALLRWSQEDLAAASGLSVSTVRNLESRDMSPRSATTTEIRRAIENAGLEFLEPEGVRRRIDEVKVYQGRDSCDLFFDDILHTVREKNGTIIAIFKSVDTLTHVCGLVRDRFERLERVNDYADLKCLLSEVPNSALPVSSFEHRIILQQHVGPVSYFVYGDKYAIIQSTGHTAFRFVVFDSVNLAQSYRSYFFSLWELAPPIFTQLKAQSRIGV